MTIKSTIFKSLAISMVLLNELGTVPALARTGGAAEPASTARHSSYLQLVDARSYWHCHNLPRHVYCHKSGRLPRKWPPNTDTPGTSSLRKLREDNATLHAGDHRHHCWFCWR